MIRRPPRSTQSRSSAASDVYKRQGVYRPRGTDHTYETSSPSMDISKASNFERFVFDLVGRDGAKVREFWSKVDAASSSDTAAFDIKGTPYWDCLLYTSDAADDLLCV